jgi:hypothetical protein
VFQRHLHGNTKEDIQDRPKHGPEVNRTSTDSPLMRATIYTHQNTEHTRTTVEHTRNMPEHTRTTSDHTRTTKRTVDQAGEAGEHDETKPGSSEGREETKPGGHQAAEHTRTTTETQRNTPEPARTRQNQTRPHQTHIGIAEEAYRRTARIRAHADARAPSDFDPATAQHRSLTGTQLRITRKNKTNAMS